MSKALDLRNVRKDYTDFSIKDISFSLKKGYIMGFIGPNGAGKSTTIKLIMNLVKRNGGEIQVLGLDNIKEEKQLKQRIGFVYDESHYYDELTVEGMKKVISGFYKNWDEPLFQKYLKEFELPYKKKIKELSKGMKMKFSLAIALSHHAELIIMDEPTSGLDPVVRSTILDILTEVIQDENKAIFFSTHITTDLDRIADYITFIHKGEVLFSKSKDELLESYGIVKGGNQLLTEQNKSEFISIRQTQFGFEALTDQIGNIRKSLKDQVIIERPTLEDIMLFTVRRDL